jgi:glycosyltransferase involved in cell wall biosynthesis
MTKPFVVGSLGYRVVILSDFGYVNGGAPQVAITSALGLTTAGVPVSFAYAVGPLDARLKEAGVEEWAIPATNVWEIRNRARAAVQGIWNAPAANALARHLENLDPCTTLIHAHQWTKAFTTSVISRAAEMRFRCVVTLHDYFLGCPNGAYYKFPQGRPCSVKPLSARCITSNCDSRSPAHKLVRLARHGAQQIGLSGKAPHLTFVHVSDFARRIAQPMLPAGVTHVVIPNPLAGAAPASRAHAEANRLYTFIGRLVPEKGCLDFAAAARAAQVPVAFAGSGPCEQEIRRINPDALMLGWLSADALVERIRHSRALVFPSRWYETSGLVCAEALAHGVPVLASRRTAAVDLIREDVNGAVFDPDDQAGFSELLRRLENSDLIARWSEGAFEHARVHLTRTSQHIDRLCALYSSIIGELISRKPLVSSECGMERPAP